MYPGLEWYYQTGITKTNLRYCPPNINEYNTYVNNGVYKVIAMGKDRQRHTFHVNLRDAILQVAPAFSVEYVQDEGLQDIIQQGPTMQARPI